MRHLRSGLLLAALAILGSAEPPPLTHRDRIAGPWLLLSPAGTHLGIAFQGAPPPAQIGRLSLRAAGRILDPPRQVGLLREGRPVTVLDWPLPTGATACHLSSGELGWEVVVPTPIEDDEPTRIAVAGPGNWPQSSELEALAGRLGGPLQAVVVPDGRGLEQVLGSGGWESGVPVAILPRNPAPEELRLVAGEALLPWPRGLAIGSIALPSALPGQAADALGQAQGDWSVLVLPEPLWDLGLQATPQQSEVAPVRSLLHLCAGQGVPLVLASGRAGFLSEPLGGDPAGRFGAQPGGCRYLAATPDGQGLGRLPAEAVMPLPGPQLFGLVSDQDRLTLMTVGQRGATAADLTLVWRRPVAGAPPAPGGWGGGEARALRERWLDQQRSATGAGVEILADLAWCAGGTLTNAGFTGEDFRALVAAGEAGSQDARRLALRLMADRQLLAAWVGRVAALPEWMQYEVVLRELADPRSLVDRWGPVVVRSRDARLVRAVIGAVERGGRRDLQEVLLDRLRLQGEGSLPFDQDPILQSRLSSLIFDSGELSPTRLRPVALTLKERLHPVARRPVLEFLRRHGEERPVP